MAMKAVYKSNRGRVGDGLRPTRISEGGQKFEILVDEKAERYSEVIFVDDEATTEPPVVDEPLPEPEPETPPVGEDTTPGGDTGGGVVTPPVIGSTVAVNETDLRDKITANPGKTIGMKSGRWGAFTMNGGRGVTVVAENPGQAIFDKFDVTNTTGGGLHGLSVIPRGDTLKASNNVEIYGFDLKPGVSGMTLSGLTVKSGDDSAGHFNWTQAQWLKRAMGGLQISGTNCTVDGLRCEAIRFGLALVGSGNKATNTSMVGVSGDAVRINDSNNQVIGFYGSDGVLVDANHPDVVQMFGRYNPSSGTYALMSNVLVRDFVFLEWTKNPTNPLRITQGPGQGKYGVMQGIGMHNPPYANIKLNRVFITTGLLNGVKISNVNGADLTDVTVASAYYGTPYYDRRFPGILVSGSNVTSKNCRANQFSGGAVQAGVNGNAVLDYSTDPTPAWAKPIIAALG